MEEEVRAIIDDGDFASSFVKSAMEMAVEEGYGLGSLKFQGPASNINHAMKRMDAFVAGWGLKHYSAESVGVGFAAGSDWSLTPSETKWLIHAIDGDEFDFDKIERSESPDFVYGSGVGIEVKSDENYKISRKQLKAMAELQKGYVYHVTRTRVQVLDTFDWIGMNEYTVDR